MMINIDKLVNKASELYNSNNNWNGVVVSKKEVNGIQTDEQCITLFVDKKLPLDQIANEDVFPSSINIDGVNYNTDVIETNQFKANSCYVLPDPSSQPESSWQMPVSGSRVEKRPLMGGISVGTFPPKGWGGNQVATGTLGGLAVDLDDYTIVGISNNHVLSNNTLGTLVGAFSASTGLLYWSFLSANDTTNSPGDDRFPVFQRSTFDKFTTTQSTMQPLTIGSVKKAMPFQSTGNVIDISSVALSGTHSLNLSGSTTNWKQYQLDISQPMDWATDAEINTLLTSDIGAPVFRSGRTEGPVGYPGSDPYGVTCKLSAYAIGNTNVDFGGNVGSIGFNDQIFFRSNKGSALSPSSGGDSGSFVCALFNSDNPGLSAWKVIGLNFAGNGTIGVMNKITNVANMFNLSAYKGDEIDIGYKGYDMQVISSRQSALTAMIGGKMYWQAGSTGYPATTSFDT